MGKRSILTKKDTSYKKTKQERLWFQQSYSNPFLEQSKFFFIFHEKGQHSKAGHKFCLDKGLVWTHIESFAESWRYIKNNIIVTLICQKTHATHRGVMLSNHQKIYIKFSFNIIQHIFTALIFPRNWVKKGRSIFSWNRNSLMSCIVFGI